MKERARRVRRDSVTVAEAARIAGLRGFETPTLEAVERRRLQLWLVTLGLLLLLAISLLALAFWERLAIPPWLTPRVLLGGLLVLVSLFSAYALEKEVQLVRLSRLLVEERVLTAALTARVRELSTLLEAGQAVNLSLDLDDVLRRILSAAMDLLEGGSGSIMLLHGSDELRTVATLGDSPARDAKARLGDGIAGTVAETAEPLLVMGALSRPSGDDDKPVPEHGMCVPLRHRGKVLGVLNINAAPDRRYSQHDLRALSLFGEQAAVAVANAQLYEAQRLIASKSTYQSLHDDLTRLSNRVFFLERVGKTLVSSRPDEVHAVLFLDLDDFKRVNDSLGHEAGDRLLVLVADRLREVTRDEDVVSRFGGDEFAVLVESMDSQDAVLTIARRILEVLDPAFRVGDREIGIRTSVGVAFARPGDPAPDVVRNADTALNEAKAEGKGRVAVYDPSMRTRAMSRMELEIDLRQAIKGNGLLLHFQPIWALGDDRLVGVEALLRWRHPDRGVLAAGDFLPLAQRMGVMPALDRWALGEACRCAAPLEEALGRPLQINVNMAPERLTAAGAVDEVAQVLDETGRRPENLVLELTEETLVRQGSETPLLELRRLGVRIAIDDFGTGYSSLGYLSRLPVDAVKVDRLFVDGLGRQTGAEPLVDAIVRLGSTLGFDVVAEGIESTAQVSYLRETGCAYGQGMLLGKPQPLQELLAEIAKR